MKLKNIKDAPISTLLAILVMVFIGIGVAAGTIQTEALIGFVPLIMFFFTDVLKEKKEKKSKE